MGKTRSRRNYNCYTFSYNALEGNVPNSLVQGAKMEISLSAISFPTIQLLVDSYIYQCLSKDNMDLVQEYHLQAFIMNLQTLERTLIDKVFAICDYYLTGKIKRNSRHLYDIYMLLPKVKQDDDFKKLIRQVRDIRKGMEICPSAKTGINIPEILKKIITEKHTMKIMNQ